MSDLSLLQGKKPSYNEGARVGKAVREALAEEDIAWGPTPKQSEFLACDDWEVLFGGAAGGGKTDGLLIDALGLQQNAIEYKTYQAFLMRRSFQDLKDLIARARDLYTQIVPSCKYNPQDHAFTFPSGARVEMIHMQHPDMRFNYRGRVCQYFGAEELTTHPSSVCYEYLIGRVRTVETRLKCYVRATTNPDGPGELWVMKRFEIPQSGHGTVVDLTIEDPETGQVYKRRRRFINARLIDNPHLTKTPEYKITLLQLPEDEREALLYGRWGMGKLKGSFYAKELSRAREENRIRVLPYVPGVPVDTYWDLGRADYTSIWFVQKIHDQFRFIKYYENSGETLAHYVKQLEATNYTFGTHHLPHDASIKRLKSREDDADSFVDMFRDLKPSWQFSVTPRIDDVMVGIDAVRTLFPLCWFDQEGTEEGRASLLHYKKEFDEKNQVYKLRPVHNWASHGADAFRNFAEVNSQEIRFSSGTDDMDDPDEDWRTV